MRALLASVLCLASACAHAPSAPPASPIPAPVVVARIGERAITLAEVDDAIKSELYQERSRALDRLIDDELLAAAARRAGKPASAYLAEAALARVRPVSSAEAEQFYERNKERLPEQLAGKSFAELEEIIIHGLGEQRRDEASRKIVAELRAEAGVKILLEPAKIEVAAVGPTRGPAGAKVTIVEFSDFRCGFCARAEPVVQEVLKSYGADVRLVYRDFPLSLDGDGAAAAEAGHCADEQGRFWALHDWMFDNQRSLTVDQIKDAAASLGIDRTRFGSCLQSGKYRDVVAASHRDGEKAGVTGTPAFFINGTMIKGALPFEVFKGEIDRALGR